MKIIGNTTATPVPQADWNQNDPMKADYIKNKPIDLATIDWVREYVHSLLTAGCAITENSSNGLTYDILAYRYTKEENNSGGNTIII